jgi:hypothetical protein
MDTNSKLEEIHCIAVKLHGVGVGVTYKEHHVGEHTLQLYRSRYKDGNVNLYKEVGESYEDVINKMYEKFVVLGSPVIHPELLDESQTGIRQRLVLSGEEREGVRFCYSVDQEVWEGNEKSELAAFLAGVLNLRTRKLWIAQRLISEDRIYCGDSRVATFGEEPDGE